MPKISIVIIVYNTEQYLHQCLDSAVGQSLKDIEIVVVNDRSPGNCREIVEEYQKNDARIKYIEHETNKGSFAARQTGILAASGEYIQLLDSDDWLDHDTCQSIYEALQNSQAEACFYGFKKIIDGKVKEIISYKEYTYNQEQFTKAYLEYDIIRAPNLGCNYGVVCYIIKKEVFQKILQRLPQNLPRLIIMEDFFLTSLYFLEIQKLVGISHVGYNYRYTAGVSMRKNTEPLKPTTTVIRVLLYVYEIWKQTPEMYAVYGDLCEACLLSHWEAWSNCDTFRVTQRFYDILQILYALEETHSKEDIKVFIEVLLRIEKVSHRVRALGIKKSWIAVRDSMLSLMLSLLNKFLQIIGIGKKF